MVVSSECVVLIFIVSRLFSFSCGSLFLTKKVGFALFLFFFLPFSRQASYPIFAPEKKPHLGTCANAFSFWGGYSCCRCCYCGWLLLLLSLFLWALSSNFLVFVFSSASLLLFLFIVSPGIPLLTSLGSVVWFLLCWFFLFTKFFLFSLLFFLLMCCVDLSCCCFF